VVKEHGKYFQDKITADHVTKAVARIVKKGDGIKDSSPIGRSLTVPSNENEKSNNKIKPTKTSQFE